MRRIPFARSSVHPVHESRERVRFLSQNRTDHRGISLSTIDAKKSRIAGNSEASTRKIANRGVSIPTEGKRAIPS